MTALFGSGGALRKELIPSWLASQPRLWPQPHPSGKIVPVPCWHHPEKGLDALEVEVKPELELRTREQVKNLRSKLAVVRQAQPGLWPYLDDSTPPYVPDELPEGWTIEDVLGGLSAVDEDTYRLQQSWVNRLAFYRSPRNADAAEHPWSSTACVSDWGIYLHAGGLESLARDIYLATGFEHSKAIGYAAADLINHELQHAAFDMIGLRLEAAVGSASGVGSHACSPCTTEEAICTSSAVIAARARVDAADPQHTSKLALAAQRFEEWASRGPAGYRDWSQYMVGDARDRGVVEVLRHDGVPEPVAASLFRGAMPVYVMDVPVWLIIDQGSAAEAGLWAFDF